MKDEAMQECNEVPEQNLAEEPHFHAGVGPLQSDDEPQSTEQTELERLRELNTAQLQFLAVLSHELRNPATSPDDGSFIVGCCAARQSTSFAGSDNYAQSKPSF